MAYTVAERLGLRPLTIMKEWTCEELLVAFGVYLNRTASERHQEFEDLDAKTKQKIPVERRPPEYMIRFITFDQLAEMTREPTEEEKQKELEQQMQVEAFMKGGAKFY